MHAIVIKQCLINWAMSTLSMDQIVDAISKYLHNNIRNNRGKAFYFTPTDVLKWYNNRSITVRNRVLTRYVLDASSVLGITLYNITAYKRYNADKYYNAYITYMVDSASYAWQLALEDWRELRAAIKKAVNMYDKKLEKTGKPLPHLANA